jgi:hypothetical protein
MGMIERVRAWVWSAVLIALYVTIAVVGFAIGGIVVYLTLKHPLSLASLFFGLLLGVYLGFLLSRRHLTITSALYTDILNELNAWRNKAREYEAELLGKKKGR